MNLESEELNMEKIPEWIYAPTNFSPELEKTFAAVEKALGFKLFIWQKTFQCLKVGNGQPPEWLEMRDQGGCSVYRMAIA